jgi:hypothetical protein
VLEQKGQVGGHRRSEREDQSEDHDKRPVWTPCLLTVRPAGARASVILPGST